MHRILVIGGNSLRKRDLITLVVNTARQVPEQVPNVSDMVKHIVKAQPPSEVLCQRVGSALAKSLTERGSRRSQLKSTNPRIYINRSSGRTPERRFPSRRT